MRAKLERIATYLAGEQGPSADALRSELADPESEASQLFEAVRAASKRMLEFPSSGEASRPPLRSLVPLPPAVPLIESSRRPSRPTRSRVPRLSVGVATAAAALAMIVGLGALGWHLGERVGQLDQAIVHREAFWRQRFSQLEKALARGERGASPTMGAPPLTTPQGTVGQVQNRPSPESRRPPLPMPTPSTAPSPAPMEVIVALNRVEAKLNALERQIGMPPPNPNPNTNANPVAGEQRPNADVSAVARLREDLDSLREGLEASDRVGRQESQELRESVQNILFLLRQMAMRQNQGQAQIPIPFPLPMPGQNHRPPEDRPH